MNEVRKHGFAGDARQAVTATLILLVLCGLIFPLVMTGLSSLLFPHQAGGSLITADGKVIGAEYIGQEFTEDYFMKGRPSAYHYNTYSENEDGTQVYSDGSEFGGIASGSSNYAPSNPALTERVEGDIEAFLEANPEAEREEIPADMVTASGSGLDPHISTEAAMLQLPAIAEASGIEQSVLEEIVENNTTHRLLGIFGGEGVNVLGVNLDIALEMGLVSEVQGK